MVCSSASVSRRENDHDDITETYSQRGGEITLADESSVSVRLIDCVGFMVEGANGHLEGDGYRMVHTPWFEEEIPFSDAARIGTEKVIKDHATIGIVVTTDRQYRGNFPRENYAGGRTNRGGKA